MSKELVISANRHETRVAVLDEDQLVEVHFQRSNEYSLAGSIHKGRVTRVLPGMQSAFVDVGLERDTFLYVSDFLEEHEDFDEVTGGGAGEVSGEVSGEGTGGVPGEVTGQARPARGPGRDRNRDRDRDRRRDPRQVPAHTRSHTASNTPQLGGPPPLPTQSDEGTADATEAPSAPIEPAGEGAMAALSGATVSRTGESRDRGDREGDDRNDRRSRRRRRGRGFPDSKYASSQGGPPRGGRGLPGERPAERTPERPAEAARPLGAPEEAESAAPPPEPALILPGESLAKYRSAPPAALRSTPRPAHATPPVEETKPAEAVESFDNEYDEPIHYLPENALPDAPSHSAAEMAPEIPGGIPVSELPPPLPPMPPPSSAHHFEAAPDLHPHAPHRPALHPQAQHEHTPAEPAVAPMLDEEEDRDIQAMILGESGAVDFDEDGEEESPEERAAEADSGEPVSAGPGLVEAGSANSSQTASGEPTSGTAEVRDRGGRYPHRGSRRNRRRGRGGPQDGSPEGRPQDGRSAETRQFDARPPEARQAEARQQEAGQQDAKPPDARADAPPNRPDSRLDNRGDQRERTVARPVVNQLSISDLLKEGQEIIVQIAKEPLGQKGARITSHIALPGRYVVFMPTLEHMGVSRKIASDEERHRLKRVLQAKRPGPVGGFITRTAAEGRTEEEIGSDMEFLYNLWQDIRTKAERRPAPLLLHHDLDIVQRILRDQLADNFKAIWIDNEEMYEGVLRFVERFQPALVGKVKLYTREAPIFDAFGVTAELEKALRPKVWLKSGGYIVINQTEALVAIDVNTGKFVGKSNRLEDTIVKTNTEAIKEIVRQIRLRDLGGIIVIDFIDMDERKNRQKVMQALEEAMRVDRAPYKILQFNDFGLVAITRKRVKQSLERTLCSPCPHCEGAGYVKSVQTIVSEILTEARKMSSSMEGKEVMLRVHPDVAKSLKSNQNKYLEELEEVLRRPVLIKSDAQLHHEKFDLA